MVVLEETAEVTFEILTEADAVEAGIVWADQFSSREPLSKGKVVASDFDTTEAFMKDAASHKLSIIAREKSSKKIVCLAVCHDILIPMADFASNDKFRHILHLLDSLEHKYLQNHKIEKGQVLHFFVGCTVPAWEGKGLGTLLRKLMIRLAKQHNFQTILIEATNPATQHIWKKFNGQVVDSVQVSSFSSDPDWPYKNQNDLVVQLISVPVE